MINPFLWGTATSAHQVEGDNRLNDWWAAETAGFLQYPSGRACGHYSRYLEDISIISRLGHNAHRLSIEWSRLEPEENCWNEEAVQHYQNVLRALNAAGIEPVLTLHHFTNPVWFARKGGWLHPDAPKLFRRYVNCAVKAFGPFVRYWITINEPLVYAYFSYVQGEWPPGHRSMKEAVQVVRNMLLGHIEAYREIHRLSKDGSAMVSLAKHVSSFSPRNTASKADRLAVWLRDWYFNRLCFNALLSGFLWFPGIYCELLPMRGALDFLGVNYYTHQTVRAAFRKGVPFGDDCEPVSASLNYEKNALGWDVYPEGMLKQLRALKSYRLPVFICENGICTQDDGQRIRFIQDHLEQVRRAQAEEIDIQGYFYWSLLDNFEWAHGFAPRFGIVGVDYQSLERKIHPSAYVLSDICRKLPTSNRG